MSDSKFPSYQQMYERLQNEKVAHQMTIQRLNGVSRAKSVAWAADREAAFKVVDVYKDPETMLAYLRGDPSKLHDAIMELEKVLGPR